MAKANYRVKRYNSAERPQLKALVVWKDDAGKRQRKFFETVKEAETFAQHRETELLNQGREALGFSTPLRVMAQRCDGLLAPHGKTIEDATRHFLEYLKRETASVSLDTVLVEFLAHKKAQRVCNQYYGTLRSQLGAFVARLPGKLVCNVTLADCNEFLATREVGALARNCTRLALVLFFNFAKDSGYCERNPALKTPRVGVAKKPVGILSAEELARLLEAACPQTLAFIALGAFAGIRSAELVRLSWQDVDLQQGFIKIEAEKSKTARRRVIEIQPCLRAWLAPLAKPRGPIFSGHALPKRMIETRDRAGMAEWPKNALRHSFASYHLAHFKNANSLALEMGHAGCNMIFEHYREVVAPGAALQYWNITPADESKVLELSLANQRAPHSCASQPRQHMQGRAPFVSAEAHILAYPKTQREYAKTYGVSRGTIRKWQDLGRPLDSPAAMCKLRRQRYARPWGEYCARYGKQLNTVKLWAKAGWPLDDPEAMKFYIARQKPKRTKPTQSTGQALRLVVMPTPRERPAVAPLVSMAR